MGVRDGALGRLARRLGRSGVERPLLRRGYEALIAAEVGVATAWASRHTVRPTAPPDLTLVVKTFERPDVLRRMLASVRRV